MECGVFAAPGDVWLKGNRGGGGGSVGKMGDGFSHDSEHDLSVMVRDFLENGSSGTDSRYSSDSESGFCDLAHLADKISLSKLAANQFESDLFSVVNSLILSINEIDLHIVKSGLCNASCIRFALVKLLRLSGYDAGLCASRWQGNSKVPGGDHEYIDVISYGDMGSSERVIIDIDFHSHFEIARAVELYDRILDSLPVVYVGTYAKLKQLLQVMAEAAKSSLKQNSMPLPPWRSFAYLQAKWQSPYQRKFNSDDPSIRGMASLKHTKCNAHLRRIQSALHSETEAKRLFKPISENRRPNLVKWWHSSLRTI